jgi:hypothetical protein
VINLVHPSLVLQTEVNSLGGRYLHTMLLRRLCDVLNIKPYVSGFLLLTVAPTTKLRVLKVFCLFFIDGF